MTLQRKTVLICLLVVLAMAGATLAQGTAQAGQASQEAATSLPSLDEVLSVINKTTGPNADGQADDWSAPVKLAAVFFLLAVLPSLLVMVTSFTRIVIVLSFLRRALTTQNIPPTIALVGLALFLTLFTMAPTFSQVSQQAVQPYLNDQVSFPEACATGRDLLKEFMARQIRPADLELFVELAGGQRPESVADIPAHVMVPSFAISEFRKAFEMGCLIFIPFLVVDLVISGILLSAGMMMLPPALISLPFKIILFVLVDGWQLVARTVVTSFN